MGEFNIFLKKRKSLNGLEAFSLAVKKDPKLSLKDEGGLKLSDAELPEF